MKFFPQVLVTLCAVLSVASAADETETVDSRPECESHSDCRDFCAADGTCENIGGCAVVDDCLLEVNQGYAVALCFGGMECKDRACAMNCSGGSDALMSCRTSENCFEPGEYCTTDRICRPGGICFADADCSLPDNQFSSIDIETECVGRFFCDDNNKCGKECGDGDSMDEPICTEDGGQCQNGGVCVVATMDGEQNYCVCPPTYQGTRCDEPIPSSIPAVPSVPEIRSCTTSDDCDSDSGYCAGDGLCLPFGTCAAEKDCLNANNESFFASCVGTITCDSGLCGKVCDTTKEDGSAVSIDVTQCKSDSDCISITTSTTRAAVLDHLSYCAHGVCTKHSSCFTDADCINPSNVLFGDKECIGYLYCTEMGTCDRVCGEECKNGSPSVECFAANPCDTQPLCEGAVSCAMTTCDGDCNALYYTADGQEFSCDSVVMPWDDNSDTKGETTTDSGNLDSSAVFRGTSSYVALLVAVLAAAVIV